MRDDTYVPLQPWERELLGISAYQRQQAVIAKYDKALKALHNNPVAVVESTFRGLLGEFYREMEAIDA